MTRPVYPTSLPAVRPYELNPDDQVLRTEEPSVPLQLRRLTSQASARIKVSWRYFGNDFEIFRTWWRDELLRGHRWFEMPLYSVAGYVPHVVRFLGPYTSRETGHGYREVNAELEVRDRVFNYMASQAVQFTWVTYTQGDLGYPPPGQYHPDTLTLGPYSCNTRITVSDVGESKPDDYFFVDDVQIQADMPAVTALPVGFVIKDVVPANTVVQVKVKNLFNIYCGGQIYLQVDPVV